MMTDLPRIRTVGLSGLLITFADRMTEPANRAALAFRAAVEQADWPEVQETSTSLVSTFVQVDLASVPAAEMTGRLQDLIATQDWLNAPLPQGRKLWHIPTVYGTDLAPQLEEAATAAGVDPDTAIRDLSTARVRVLTIGFAPGQPYLGELPAHWDIPRQQALSKSVPAGALVVAIRQLVLFTNDTPTGWRHVGQTGFRTFRQKADTPFALSPGDELTFPAITPDALRKIEQQDTSGNGGADPEELS